MLRRSIFAGGILEGLQKKIPYFQELGLTYLHLMPLYQVPEGENDGGYAVTSYRQVDPKLGSMAELRELATELRVQGISLVLDLIYNHTADNHIWAQKALAGDQQYQNYYRMFSDRTIPDAYERTLREIFPEEHPGAFTYNPQLQKWVLDHLSFLPMGSELCQSRGFQPDGRRNALHCQYWGRNSAFGRSCLHLERNGYRL